MQRAGPYGGRDLCGHLLDGRGGDGAPDPTSGELVDVYTTVLPAPIML